MRLGSLTSVLLALMSLPIVSQTTLADPAGGTYLGQASTGEAVYYVGARFQCGDLPRTDECWWRTPMVVYRIGSDSVTAIADCQQRVFREIWLDGEIVAREMHPQSEAIRLMIDNACQRH